MFYILNFLYVQNFIFQTVARLIMNKKIIFIEVIDMDKRRYNKIKKRANFDLTVSAIYVKSIKTLFIF